MRLLGVRVMAGSVDVEGDSSSFPELVREARQLMAAALKKLDEAAAPPHLGAHLQTALDALDESYRR